MMIRKMACAGALLFSLAAAPIGAATVLDTGQPTGGGPEMGISTGNSFALQFTIDATTTITGIEGWMRSASPDDLVIGLYGNGVGGTVPGTELQSASFTSGSGNVPGWYGANVAWTLVAGTYWVSFEDHDDTGFALLPTGAPHPAPTALGDGGSDWLVFPRSIGVRITAADPAVPEPATWATMILGFGLVGAAMRRRTAKGVLG